MPSVSPNFAKQTAPDWEHKVPGLVRLKQELAQAERQAHVATRNLVDLRMSGSHPSTVDQAQSALRAANRELQQKTQAYDTLFHAQQKHHAPGEYQQRHDATQSARHDARVADAGRAAEKAGKAYSDHVGRTGNAHSPEALKLKDASVAANQSLWDARKQRDDFQKGAGQRAEGLGKQAPAAEQKQHSPSQPRIGREGVKREPQPAARAPEPKAAAAAKEANVADDRISVGDLGREAAATINAVGSKIKEAAGAAWDKAKDVLAPAKDATPEVGSPGKDQSALKPEPKQPTPGEQKAAESLQNTLDKLGKSGAKDYKTDAKVPEHIREEGQKTAPAKDVAQKTPDAPAQEKAAPKQEPATPNQTTEQAKPNTADRAAGGILGAIGGAAKGIADGVKNGYASGSQYGMPVVGALLGGIGGAGYGTGAGAAKGLAEGGSKLIAGAGQSAAGAVSAGITEVKGTANSMGEAASNAVSAGIQGLKDMVGRVGKAASGAATAGVAGAADIPKNIASGISSGTIAGGVAGGLVGGAKGATVAAAKGGALAVAGGLKAAGGSVTGTIGGAVKGLMDGAKKGHAFGSKYGMPITSSLLCAIGGAAWGAGAGAAKGLASGLATVATGLGHATVGAIGAGVKGAMDGVKSGSAMMKDAMDATRGTVPKHGDLGKEPEAKDKDVSKDTGKAPDQKQETPGNGEKHAPKQEQGKEPTNGPEHKPEEGQKQGAPEQKPEQKAGEEHKQQTPGQKPESPAEKSPERQPREKAPTFEQVIDRQIKQADGIFDKAYKAANEKYRSGGSFERMPDNKIGENGKSAARDEVEHRQAEKLGHSKDYKQDAVKDHDKGHSQEQTISKGRGR